MTSISDQILLISINGSQASFRSKAGKKNEKSQLLNPLSTNPRKWSNTLKQFVSNLPTNCLSVFDQFMKLSLKDLK